MNDVDNGIRKNETFIVKDFDDEYIYLEDEIKIKISKLHNYFILGYCITTYKSQGDTYKGKIVIFESNKMFDDVRHIYTAITRTDKYSNLIFM